MCEIISGGRNIHSVQLHLNAILKCCSKRLEVLVLDENTEVLKFVYNSSLVYVNVIYIIDWSLFNYFKQVVNKHVSLILGIK